MSMSLSSIGHNSAMDGRISNAGKISSPGTQQTPEHPIDITQTAAAVTKELQNVKAQVTQLQDITNILGRKLVFNVNEALGEVVVKIVDPETDKVIKEIPSADVQKLQIRIRETLGLLIDEKI